MNERISDRLAEITNSRKQPVQDKKKLEHQQKYYERLAKSGVVRKQAYDLKPISAI